MSVFRIVDVGEKPWTRRDFFFKRLGVKDLPRNLQRQLIQRECDQHSRLIRGTETRWWQMGIPHLTTFLRPYAERSSLAGENVVIDGPGLAYHIYYLCLSCSSSARNPFEASPSYQNVGKAVIGWLDTLQMSGVVM